MLALRPVAAAVLSVVLASGALRGQRPPAAFTIAVNTTIEAGPVYVARAGLAGAGFQVIN